MREMSLDDIRRRVEAQNRRVDDAVNRFRVKSEEEGWAMRRIRPRDPDEIKALDKLARRMILEAMATGRVRYDKEKREMVIVDFGRGQAEADVLKGQG